MAQRQPTRAEIEQWLLSVLPETRDPDSAVLFVTGDDAWLLKRMGIRVDDDFLPVLKIWPETLAR